MKLVVVIILIISGIGLFLVFKPNALPNNAPVPQKEEQQQVALPKEVEVPLESQNNSNQIGVATLQKIDGKLAVRINLKGEPKDASQPAHIHTGSCPSPKEERYTLNAVVNGLSETILDTNGDDLVGMRPLAINVHKSASEISSYIACGNVEF